MLKLLLLLLLFGISVSQDIRVPYAINRNDFSVEHFQNYLSFSVITDVQESSNTIYFSTLGGGLLRYDKFKEKFLPPYTTANGLYSNFIYKLKKSAQDSTFSTSNEIGVYYKKSMQVISTDQPDDFRLQFSSPTFFKGYEEIDKNKLSFELNDTENYVIEQPYQFFDKEIQDGNFTRYKITLRYNDNSDGVWLFAENLGLFYTKVRSGYLKKLNIQTNFGAVTRVEINKSDYWFTQYSGDNRLNPVLSKWEENGTWKSWYEKYTFALQGRGLFDIASSGNTLWLADEFGLVSYSENDRSFKSYRFGGAYNKKVTSIVNLDSIVYFGTEVGLYQLIKQSGKINELKLPGINKERVISLAYSHGSLVIICRNSVFEYDVFNHKLNDLNAKFNLPNALYTCVEFNEGKFRIGSHRGLVILDLNNDLREDINLISTKESLFINSIKYSNGYTFLATNLGLYIYYKEKSDWLLFNSRSGFPVDMINDIEIDGDFLIAGTNAGVSVFKWYDEFYWN